MMLWYYDIIINKEDRNMTEKELIKNQSTIDLMEATITLNEKLMAIRQELSDRGWDEFYCNECHCYHENISKCVND
jgi:hypothetical protein